MDCGMLGFPVLHYFPEFAQTHIHWVHDAISSSVTPSPALNLSQHQGLLHWISSSHQVAKVLEFQLHHQSFQWIFKTYFLEDWLVWSPCSPRDSQESSPTPQLESINSLAFGFTTTGKTIALTLQTFVCIVYTDTCIYRHFTKCLSFLIHYLGLSWLFFQGASAF